jgi:hippurate hydrolase
MNQSPTAYLLDDMTAWRHDFHRHPELGFEEQRTSARVAELLSEWGIETHTGIGGTGVVGVLRRGEGPRCIGLRADMDALAIAERNSFAHASVHEGTMHACGHDGHTAMLLGAARHLAGEGDFDGTVVFIFQPAEEHGKGARAMLDDGLFERFDVRDVYAMHNYPTLPAGHFVAKTGPVMASEDNFEIVIEGRGHHAAMPHAGVDPIVIASQVVLALQTIVSRSANPVDDAVISVTEFVSDGTVNVVPDSVTLRGDTRSFTPEVQAMIERRMREVAEGICAAHGAACRFSYVKVFEPTINTPAETAIAARVARAVVGDDRVDTEAPPIMGSEDFAFMLQARPGCYLLLGNGGEGPHACSVHNASYDFNDAILGIGADFWVRLVESELAAP